jgi:hypothetical protein
LETRTGINHLREKKSRLATWTRRDCENYNTLKDKMISYVLLLNQLDSEAATLSHVEL